MIELESGVLLLLGEVGNRDTSHCSRGMGCAHFAAAFPSAGSIDCHI